MEIHSAPAVAWAHGHGSILKASHADFHFSFFGQSRGYREAEQTARGLIASIVDFEGPTIVPYEKAYILRDGKRVEFAVGAVLLSEEPFVWAAYTVDLSEVKKLRQAKHDLLARERIVNQLAHELNNPLAALTFPLHLVVTQDDLSERSRGLIEEALHQLGRVARASRRFCWRRAPLKPKRQNELPGP